MKDQYLGDGVYVSHDSFQLWLAVNDHRNKVIAIDRDVYDQLRAYGDKFYGVQQPSKEQPND
jgi:hypothetical protein